MVLHGKKVLVLAAKDGEVLYIIVTDGLKSVIYILTSLFELTRKGLCTCSRC